MSVFDTISNISTKIQNAGADFAQAHPTTAHQIYSTANQAAYNVRSVVPTIQQVDRAGYESARGGYEDLSQFSKKAHETTKYVSSTIRAGVPILEQKLNTKVPGVGTVMGFPVRSTAGLIEMGGMVPGGVETMARNPGVIAPSLARGAYDSTIGMGRAFKANPAQTTSDIATAALFFGGAARVAGPRLAGSTRVVSSRVPRLTRTNVQPDILIKGDIALATAPKAKAPSTGLVPYRGKPSPGMDLTPFKPRTQGKTPTPPYSEPSFFIGERLGPTAAEGYIRVPAKMAKTLQKEYEFSNVRQVKTDYGSFVELEGIKPRSQRTGTDFQRIAQAQDRAMLGELPKGKSSRVRNPYRMEHRLNIEAADLETGSSLKTVPGNIIEVNGKVVDPLQITGGVRDPFRFNEFMSSEKGTLRPTKYKDPIQEMFPERMFDPQPQFKRGGKVALKERGNNPAMADIQNIFERSKAMHEAEAKGAMARVQARARAGTKPQAKSRTKAGTFPAFSLAASGTKAGAKPSSDIFISAKPRSSSTPKTEDRFKTIIAPSTRSMSSPLPNIVPSPAPATTRTSVPFPSFADELKPTATIPVRLPVELPYLKPKPERKVSKKRRGKRFEDYYNVVNPIKDIAELMKQ